MAHIHDIKIGNTNYLIEPTLYGAATTSDSGANYAITLSNFELANATGVAVQIKFPSTNAANAKLNVNSTGAKNIYYNNAAISASVLKANHTYTLVYDGTQWQLVGDIDTNTWRGIADNLTSSTATTTSLSAKQGYLLANGDARDNTKLPLAGGKMSGDITLLNTGTGATPGIIFQRKELGDSYTDWKVFNTASGDLVIASRINEQSEFQNKFTFTYNGGLTAVSFTGDGSALTSLNGSNISSGTVAFARLPTGTGASQVAIGNHTHTITATATDGLWDLTGTNGTNSVTYALAPYSAKQSTASFYTAATNPSLTTRLNYDGYLYATKLYSGGTEVSVSGHTHSHLVSLATINSGDNTDNTFKGAIKKYFNDNKATVPRNSLVNFYSSAYSNGAEVFGYYLSSYDNNPYGGFFVAHYDTPRYVGISSGSYTEAKLARIDTANTITTGQVMISDGTDGKIKSSGYTIAKSVPSNAIFTDHYAWTDITGKPTKITLTGAVTGNVSLGEGELTLSTTVNHNHNSSYLTAVGYDTTNKKIYYTKNGSNTDVVTVATLRTDMGLSNALHFIGITSTELSDGSTTSTLTAKSTNSLSKTTGFVDGDVVMDGDQLREYVWVGSKWRLLGITTSTAYSQTATGNSWITSVTQGTDGKITATTGSLVTTGEWSGNAGSATNISSRTPTLAASTESNEITVIDLGNNAPESGKAHRHAIDFKWYNSHWAIGNLRSSSSPSAGFGISYSSDGTTYANTVVIGTNGKITATGFIGALEGNADSATYATSAGSVAWANTGHPDTFPPTIGTTATTAMAGNTVVTNVSYTSASDNASYPILMKNSTGSTTTAAGTKFNTGVTINPSDQTITANEFIGNLKGNNVIPTLQKTYTGNYYGTGNDYNSTSFFFISLKPDTWYKPWKIKFKIRSYCPAHTECDSVTYGLYTGRLGSYSYANWNERNDSYAHYYTSVRTLNKTGFDAGLSHALGICLRYASNYTNTGWPRTFEVEIYDYEGCTVTLLDTPLLWANWPNAANNYNGWSVPDAVTRGLCETNDATGNNDDKTLQDIMYFRFKSGAAGIGRYTLLMEETTGVYSSLTTTFPTSNTPLATLTMNTGVKYKLGRIIYFNQGANRAANTNIANDNQYFTAYSLIDGRYTFQYAAGALTAYKPFYMVGTLDSNGFFTIDPAATAWAQDLPIANTTKVYVYLGTVYPDTNPYRIALELHHPIYTFKDGALKEIHPGISSGNADTATTATNLANNPSIQTSGTTQITITAGGKTSSAYTVPYATNAGTASNVTTTADTSNSLYLTGVTSNATSTLKHNTNLTISGTTLAANDALHLKTTASNSLIFQRGDTYVGAFNTSNNLVLGIGDSTTWNSVTGSKLYVNGRTLLNNSTASSTAGLSSQLVVRNNAGSPGNVAIELVRGSQVNTTYTSWQIAVEGGDLHLRNNYNANGSGLNTTYTYDAFSLVRNTGSATFKGSVTATTYYGALESRASTANLARHVWFSYSTNDTAEDEGVLGKDDDFEYNPNTNVLTVGKITVNGGDNSVISTTGTMKLSCSSGNTVTIDSGSTMYLNKPTNASIIFTSGGAATSSEKARINTNGNLQLDNSNLAGTQNTHKLYVHGDSAFEGKISFGTAASNAISVKASMEWNETDKSIDFIFT